MKRFQYALEPVRQQREWQLVQATARVAQVQAQLAAARDMHAQAETSLQRDAGLVAGLWQRMRDPSAHVMHLGHLTAGAERLAALKNETDRLEEALRAAQEALTQAHRRSELLQEHRVEEKASWAAEIGRVSAVEADRAWLQRRPATAEGGDV